MRLLNRVTVVVRQNFSRVPKRGGSGGVAVNTIIDSVQQEEPKRASPVRVKRAYIIYIKDRPKVDPKSIRTLGVQELHLKLQRCARVGWPAQAKNAQSVRGRQRNSWFCFGK
jgi:hypothetical protein